MDSETRNWKFTAEVTREDFSEPFSLYLATVGGQPNEIPIQIASETAGFEFDRTQFTFSLVSENLPSELKVSTKEKDGYLIVEAPESLIG